LALICPKTCSRPAWTSAARDTLETLCQEDA